MHTCAERKTLPFGQPARGAAARSASLNISMIPAFEGKKVDIGQGKDLPETGAKPEAARLRNSLHVI